MYNDNYSIENESAENESSENESTENESIENESIDNESTDDESMDDDMGASPEWEVYDYDRKFFNSKKKTNMYYIGTYDVICYNNIIEPIFDIALSRDAFFKFSSHLIIQYINSFNMHVNNSKSLEIIKLYIHNNVYIAILKTFWIRIIQRTWKRIMNKRQEIIQLRKRLNSIHHYEKTGKFPSSLRYLPNIFGMLYSSKD